MRALVACLAFVVLLATPFAAASEAGTEPFAKDPPEVGVLLRAAADTISGQRIYDCIDEITTSGVTSYRLMGSPNSDAFVQRYGKVFSSLSPRIKDQVVTFKQGNLPAGAGPASPTGKNIIGVLPGNDPTKWVVIGGHYDTQVPTTGAIDNTSGICVVKEIARAVLSLDVTPEATMVFAWWDGEEWGLYGASSFVRDHSKTAELLGVPIEDVRILVGQSFDIVGINYPAYNTWVGYGEQSRIADEYATLNLRTSPTDESHFRPLYSRLGGRDDKEQMLVNFSRYAGLVKEVNHHLLKRPERYVNVHDDQYGRSDHVPFIAQGIPGMRIQGSHDYQQWPHYHLPTDTLATAALMAGGQDRLIAGFNAAAEAGGLTAFYVGLTGGYGDYSNMTVEAAPLQEPAATLEATGQGIGSVALPLAVLGALGGLLVRRRRA